MKLISLSEYIGLQEKHIPYENAGTVSECDRIFVKRVISYQRFLKQPLKLEMFVPCDEYGNVLEEPSVSEFDNFDLNEGGQVVDYERYNNACDEYEKAKERLLFKGFEIGKYGNGSMYLKGCHNNYTIINGEIYDDNENAAPQKTKDTIEDLLYMNNGIELTPTAIKQIQP